MPTCAQLGLIHTSIHRLWITCTQYRGYVHSYDNLCTAAPIRNSRPPPITQSPRALIHGDVYPQLNPQRCVYRPSCAFVIDKTRGNSTPCAGQVSRFDKFSP